MITYHLRTIDTENLARLFNSEGEEIYPVERSKSKNWSKTTWNLNSGVYYFLEIPEKPETCIKIIAKTDNIVEEEIDIAKLPDNLKKLRKRSSLRPNR